MSIGGEQKPAIRVQVDPAKLAGMGLTLEDIRPALVAATTDAPKGALDTPITGFTLAANDQVTTAAAFDNVVVAHRNGASVRVCDIGRAVAAAADRTAAAYYNGKPAILLTIYRQPGANVIATVRRIEAKLPALSADLPAGITLDTVLNRTTTIRASVKDVEFTLGLTIVLVVLIVGLFLRNLRATLVPGATLVVVVLGTFAVMAALGFSLDNLSLMGLTIAVGFVVDDTIVVVENIYRHVESGTPPLQAALAGTREIGFTVLAMSLSLVAVLLPIGFMSGIVGRLFRELAFTVIAAVAVSLVASLTFAPMLCRLVARKPDHAPERRLFTVGDWFKPVARFYERTLDVALRHTRLMLALLAATVALTLGLVFTIPKGFFPAQDTGLIQALADAPQSVSPTRMRRLERQIDAIVRKDPAVQDVASWTGSTGGNGFAQTANTARYFIVLKPRSQREHSAQGVIAQLQKQLDGVSDAVLHMHATQDITVGGRNSRGNFEYTLQDPNPVELHTWARRVLAAMHKLPEIESVASDLQDDAPQLSLDIDRRKAATLGVSIQAIDDTLDDAYGQRQITQYFTETGTYPIILELMPHALHRVASLGDLYVESSLTNSLVPLSTVVDVDSRKVGPLSVTHQGQFPAVTLSFNLRPGVSLGQAVDAIHRAVAATHMPASFIGKFQGNAGAFQQSLTSLPWLVVLSLIAVYVILGVLYESFHRDFDDLAVREACLLRLRPILMTTAAAMLAGVALAAAHGTGSAFQRPLGFTIVGGLLLSQLLTLYTTPVVYVYLSGLRRRRKAASGAITRQPAEQ